MLLAVVTHTLVVASSMNSPPSGPSASVPVSTLGAVFDSSTGV
eukprot:CAMPEP_0196753464 /NCGR_PEP_ID=MMETSP1091-20130531/90857_1 /TAXON_ID=302021 /ORGANISM="Rhodomonas sp., Strain CCMP768" /LENGTH=42 /DNA_ID= /DNA_START= /DNA_END= /DNA_ORIENTATION=